MDDRAPDLILLDIMLPGDDGLTILKKLRSSSEYDNIPVIIISAKTTELDRVKGLDHEKKDCIQPVLYGHNHRGNRNSHNNHCLLRIFHAEVKENLVHEYNIVAKCCDKIKTPDELERFTQENFSITLIEKDGSVLYLLTA